MDLWSGLVAALPDDGNRSLVGLAEGWVPTAAIALFYPTRTERRLDADLLRRASARLGTGGNHPAMACHPFDNAGFLPSQQASRVDARPLSGVGDLRRISQLHPMADESGVNQASSNHAAETWRIGVVAVTAAEYRQALDSLPYGKRLPSAVYLVDPGDEASIPSLLRVTVSELRKRLEIGTEFNLLKFHIASPKISFLAYPECELIRLPSPGFAECP